MIGFTLEEVFAAGKGIAQHTDNPNKRKLHLQFFFLRRTRIEMGKVGQILMDEGCNRTRFTACTICSRRGSSVVPEFAITYGPTQLTLFSWLWGTIRFGDISSVRHQLRWTEVRGPNQQRDRVGYSFCLSSGYGCVFYLPTRTITGCPQGVCPPKVVDMYPGNGYSKVCYPYFMPVPGFASSLGVGEVWSVVYRLLVR